MDQVLKALADATRRDMIERLARGPASVGELAQPLTMSLPAAMQHLQVLENAGLIRSTKVGRVRTCQLEPAGLRMVENWLGRQRTPWEHSLDLLGDFLAQQPENPDEGARS